MVSLHYALDVDRRAVAPTSYVTIVQFTQKSQVNEEQPVTIKPTKIKKLLSEKFLIFIVIVYFQVY